MFKYYSFCKLWWLLFEAIWKLMISKLKPFLPNMLKYSMHQLVPATITFLHWIRKPNQNISYLDVVREFKMHTPHWSRVLSRLYFLTATRQEIQTNADFEIYLNLYVVPNGINKDEMINNLKWIGIVDIVCLTNLFRNHVLNFIPELDIPHGESISIHRGYSLLAEIVFYSLQLNVPVEKNNICFLSYWYHIIKLKWKVIVPVSYNNKSISGELLIISPDHDVLLVPVCIINLGIELKDVDEEWSMHLSQFLSIYRWTYSRNSFNC